MRVVKVKPICIVATESLAKVLNSKLTVFSQDDVSDILNLRDNVPRPIVREYRKFREMVLPVLQRKAIECCKIIEKGVGVRLLNKVILDLLSLIKVYTDICIDSIWIIGITNDISASSVSKSEEAGLISTEFINEFKVIYPRRTTIVKALGIELSEEEIPPRLVENIKRGKVRGKGYLSGSKDEAWIRVEYLEDHKDPVAIMVNGLTFIVYGDYLSGLATVKRVLTGEVRKVIFWDL